MLIGPAIALTRLGNRRLTLDDVLAQYGITPAISLNAGDADSYPGTGTTWSDVSGNSRDFTLTGLTFNGTSDGLSAEEYFSTAGSGYATKASANDALLNGLHQDSAAWTAILIAADLNVSGVSGLFATRGGTTGNLAQHGISFVVTASNGLSLYVANGSGSALGLNAAGNAGEVPTSGIVMIACAFDEAVGADGGLFYLSTGYTETFTSTVTSPSSSDASNTASIFATGTNNPMVSGAALHDFALVGSALSSSQLALIQRSIAGEYGL